MTALVLPQIDMKAPVLEASNHVCKVTDELSPDGMHILPTNDLHITDRPVALATLCFFGLCLLVIVWKVRLKQIIYGFRCLEIPIDI